MEKLYFYPHSNFIKGEGMHIGSVNRMIKTVLRQTGI